MNRMHQLTGAIVSTVFLAGGLAVAEIKGSKHDFSRQEWSKGDLCAACHSPHSETAPAVGPLWNPDADLNRSFGTPIGSNQLNEPRTAFLADRRQQTGQSTLMCVRCHDGTIAPDTIAGIGRKPIQHKHNPALFGPGHGTTDHPVGVPYPRIDKGYRSRSLVEIEGTVRLPNGHVECVSCHDPHNLASYEHMLVMSNDRSALCSTCHIK